MSKRPACAVGVAALAALCLFPSAARLEAHEEPFGYVRDAETEPKGEWELTQWTTARVGKESGRYLGMDFETELEHGVTDRFQTALYLVSHYHSLRDAAGGTETFGDRNRFGISGSTVELKYQVTSAQTSPVGFALYFEPGYRTISRNSGARIPELEGETRLIFQKNFFKGRLVTAFNYIFEPELKREDGAWESELVMEAGLGASWAFNSRWRLGLEGRVRTEFPRMNLRDSEFVVFHAGPTVVYTRDRWFATLTVLPQVAGWPDSRGKGGLHLNDAERLEVRMKVGFEF